MWVVAPWRGYGGSANLYPCRMYRAWGRVPPVERLRSTPCADLEGRVKVLVVDDEPDTLEAVSVCFEILSPDSTVITATEGAAGIRMTKSERPDVVILDIGLPDVDGLEVCREIRTFSDVPIIMLTARSSEAQKVKGLETGADDYLVKPFSHIELVARARAVLRRTQASRPDSDDGPFETEDFSMNFATREVLRFGRPVKLTPTEFSLLSQLVKNAGRVVSHETLLREVWGDQYLDESEYLKVHVQNLRKKLEERPHDPRLILTERGVGYLLAKQ